MDELELAEIDFKISQCELNIKQFMLKITKNKIESGRLLDQIKLQEDLKKDYAKLIKE
jgi:hypothetical protein